MVIKLHEPISTAVQTDSMQIYYECKWTTAVKLMLVLYNRANGCNMSGIQKKIAMLYKSWQSKRFTDPTP